MRRRWQRFLAVFAVVPALLTQPHTSVPKPSAATMKPVNNSDRSAPRFHASDDGAALTEAVARADRVAAQRPGFVSVAVMDRVNGVVYGSSKSKDPSWPESVMKLGLVADSAKHLHRDFNAGEAEQVRQIIEQSNDEKARQLYETGGGDAMVHRIIDTCGLRHSYVSHGAYSKTLTNAEDVATLGDCIMANKFGLTAQQNAVLIDAMRHTMGDGAFGIRMVDPNAAQKNGYTEHSATGDWNVNCLGVFGQDNRWVLAVMTRYPRNLGKSAGEKTCVDIATVIVPSTRLLEAQNDGAKMLSTLAGASLLQGRQQSREAAPGLD